MVCRYCHKTEEVKGHGKGRTGHPRYHCYACRKTFQLNYTYQACNPGVKEQVIDIAMNNTDARNTTRVLKIEINTVIRTLKNSPKKCDRLPLEGNEIQLICEVDEQWSFVSSKKNQRWLWYAWEPRLKRIVAHVFGDRSMATLRKFLELLSPFNMSGFTVRMIIHLTTYSLKKNIIPNV
ncbi:transposase [Xenorhabdus eapokensis]|uniref:Transposase n=1 Tax=Xenorhabdus eapokensis TaxID=1873482 RepID=A0A1Q5TNX9_9GAMM|nr:transposase [Xenorhabdus eapokensis]